MPSLPRVAVLIGMILSIGCGRRAVATQTTTVAAAGPSAPTTTLTPDSPPICGDFGRAYIAPGTRNKAEGIDLPPGLGVVNERDSRILREGDAFSSYTLPDQELIRSGRARVGLDERAVYLANGLPAFYWNTEIDGRSCRVMLYGVLGQPSVDTAIYSCGNEVIHIGPVEPRLPCWRVSEVAPRAIERAPHFDGRPVEAQWEILHGLLRRGQTRDDIYVAFGDAYRTGIDAREDGTNAAEHVYLDTTGDAYAMYLTFVDDGLRGWRFPPDRRLTMEAEQRRLDAMERRMIDQMREMEQASMERHRQEVAHLTEIQTNQQRIRTDIAQARTAIIDTVHADGAETRGVVREEGERTRSAGRGRAIAGAVLSGLGRGPRARGPRRRVRRGRVETRTRSRVSVSHENGRTVRRSRTVTVSRRR